MAEYKRKNVRHSKRSAPKTEKNVRKVVHNPRKRKENNKVEESSVRVIEGNKFRRSNRPAIIGGIAIVLAITLIILNFVLPIGLNEVLGNRFASFGSGSYPHEIYGTELLNVANKGYYYYVLTDSELDAFSTGGKKILSESHGFSKPVMTCSETRSLVYDLYGNQLFICNLRGTITKKKFDEPIQAAAIGRNGTYAVATSSDTYTATVKVYNRKNKVLYQWYSAHDYISDIAVSRDGKQIAVAVLNAESGSIHSKVLVLKFDSANAVQTYDYGDNAVRALENYANGFVVLSENSCSHISWKKYEKTDYSSDESLYLSRGSNDGLLLIYNRSGDRQDNHVVVFSNKGKKITEFDYADVVTDMVYANGHVYCISDTSACMIDTSGKVLCRKKCEYGTVRLAVIDRETIAALSNSEIDRVALSN